MDNESKYRRMFALYNKWIYLDNISKRFSDHPLMNGLTEISVYGLGSIGIRLVERLGAEGIGIQYGVDKKSGILFTPFVTYAPDDRLPHSRLMIVTAICNMDEITETLRTSEIDEMISLEKVINDLWVQEWTKA